MPDQFSAFLIFVFAAALSPGGANTLSIASGIHFGYKRSLALILGMVTGMFCLPAAASFGLGALVQTQPALQTMMKIAGSLYLLWLAWQIGRAGQPDPDAARQAAPIGFIAGFALLLLNPKAWAMSFAVGASFATLAEEPVLLALIIGCGFACAAFIALSLWCLSGAVLAKLLRTARQWRAVNISLGGLLVLSIIILWI